jgi:hypothetical protein
VIVVVIGAAVVLVAVKLGTVAVPVVAVKPTAALLLVQVYTVPVVAPVNVTAVVAEPLHTVWFATAFTVGVGFTV